MKKILCAILALTLFVGAYFSLPKSLGLSGSNDVYASKVNWGKFAYAGEKITLYYYNRLGSKRSYTIEKHEEIFLIEVRYFAISEWDGHRTYVYKFDMQKYINNGMLTV